MKASVVMLRIASRGDVSIIAKLAKELATFEQQLDIFRATEEALSATLFNLPPLKGPTVLLAEVAEDAKNATDPAEGYPKADEALELAETAVVTSDPQASEFVSAYNTKRTVVGYAQFYPTYSGFLGWGKIRMVGFGLEPEGSSVLYTKDGSSTNG